MTINWRAALLSLPLAFTAGFAGAYLGGGVFAPKPQQQAPLSESVFELFTDGHELTPKQKEEVRAIGDRLRPERDALRERSRALNAQMFEDMAAERGVGPHTSKTLAELQETMGRRLTLSLTYMISVRDILTPAQQAIFDRRMKQEASESR
jgi:Spy/CpxP family protein refolding chaperone